MKLSGIQRVILLLGMIAIVLSFLFPCWRLEIAAGVAQEMSPERREYLRLKIEDRTGYERMPIDYRYAFLLTPPSSPSIDIFWTIDWPRLIVQITILAALTIGLIFLLSPRIHSN